MLLTDIGKVIVEIFVTHEIDLEKKKKIEVLGVPTIEIDLSKIDRNISELDLQDVLINKNEYKSWVYNDKREEIYKRFLEASEAKKIISRNFALHVDNCPIGKRVWKQKSYANFLDDCQYCDYFICYKSVQENDVDQERKILCSGKRLIAHVADFEVPFEKRLGDFYELVGQGICPQCGSYLVIRNGK